VWPWYVLYAITGGAVLGLELVWFRAIDGVMKANAYTFGHLLTIFLTVLALGGAVGSRLVSRVSDVRRAFLLLQLGVGGSALATFAVLGFVLPRGPAARWLESDGFIGGFDVGWGDFIAFAIALPFVTMALPVFLAGMGFPFAQAAVSRDMPTLGRHTGRLLFANLVGNVTGTLVAGFVLIDRLGTIGALTVLCLPLVGLGVAGVVGGPRPSVGRAVAGLGVVAVAALLIAALPSNTRLWAVLNGVEEHEIVLAEDRSCASALERTGNGGFLLTLNATSQNSYPYDDFHILLGMLPALAHPDPDSALAVGLGIGSTSYALLSSGRSLDVTTVELCGGNAALLGRIGDEGLDVFRRVVEDPSHRLVTGDGRRRLVADDTNYDMIVPDTVRPSTGGSGNLFSREFFELVSSRLPDDGLLSTWVPTNRTVNAVATTFPYVQAIEIESYGSTFVVASRSAIDLDRETLLARFDRIPESVFSPGQRESLRRLLADLDPECITDGDPAPPPESRDENRDLHPRDEYFLTNPLTPASRIVRTC
jgi:spermidine synthase